MLLIFEGGGLPGASRIAAGAKIGAINQQTLGCLQTRRGGNCRIKKMSLLWKNSPGIN
jgi:hypothetical protein